MGPPKPGRQHQAEIDARRAKVAALRLSGIRSVRDIAAATHSPKSTVHRDLLALEAEWRKSAAGDIATEKARDLARIDSLLSGVWAAALRGSTNAATTALNLIKLRAAILGYAAPTRVTGADGSGPVLVEHTHEHRHVDLSGFSREERDALYEVVRKHRGGTPA